MHGEPSLFPGGGEPRCAALWTEKQARGQKRRHLRSMALDVVELWTSFGPIPFSRTEWQDRFLRALNEDDRSDELACDDDSFAGQGSLFGGAEKRRVVVREIDQDSRDRAWERLKTYLADYGVPHEIRRDGKEAWVKLSVSSFAWAHDAFVGMGCPAESMFTESELSAIEDWKERQ